jgi:hypothetical protein
MAWQIRFRTGGDGRKDWRGLRGASVIAEVQYNLGVFFGKRRSDLNLATVVDGITHGVLS